METLTAINTLAALMQVLTNGLAGAAQISAIIQKAQAEGRATLTADEMASIRATDDIARASLVAAINA